MGILRIDLTRFADKYIYRTMLIASKKAITRKWLRNKVPKVEDWVEVMHNIYVMEKLAFFARLEMDRFERIWKNWIEYIKPIRLCYGYSITNLSHTMSVRAFVFSKGR